jgi:RNA polymerase sigma-70 factor (ECF subfamily)
LTAQNKLLTSFFTGKSALKADFERLAIPHLHSLYTAALYLTKNEHEAEDLVQETCLRAFRFFHKFESGTNCKAWLLSIQRRLFINRYRKTKAQPEFLDWEKIDHDYGVLLSQQHREESNPETFISSRMLRSELQDAIKDMPEEFRTAIILVDIEELTYEEAAHAMDCPIGTVRSRLNRARRILQLALASSRLDGRKS